jgi:hypothetical protein
MSKHIGHLNGSIDFLTTSGYTISVKSNYNGFKVCPQQIGQTTRRKFKEYFKLDSKWNDAEIKKWIIRNPTILFKEYFKNLFCCDYILWIFDGDVKIFKSSDIKYRRMINADFTFSQTETSWNESSTMRYENLTIGEFQFHANRDCIKFRFNLKNLMKKMNVV